MFPKSISVHEIVPTVSTASFSQTNAKMKGINNKAAAKCSKTITINAPLENVWAILSNINHWSTWQTDISKSKLNGELTQKTTFDWKTGGANIHSTLHTVTPYSQLGWTGEAFGMFAIHNWTLSEKKGRTIVRVEESMEGILVTLFKNFFNKNLEKGMQNWLYLLKKECETRH
mgnify:FL=1|jgi:hypothetical protein|tara:strand:- start:1133 stop:1651 length:519 start_codon:yes stop_codon:yes gene_type:complete